MSGRDYFEPGAWNAVCSICGRKRKSNEMVKNWQGYYRCPEHNEPRQPQDFVSGVLDIQTVPWSQPDSAIYTVFCSMNSQTAFPGRALPGCMRPGNTNYDPTETV